MEEGTVMMFIRMVVRYDDYDMIVVVWYGMAGMTGMNDSWVYAV